VAYSFIEEVIYPTTSFSIISSIRKLGFLCPCSLPMPVFN